MFTQFFGNYLLNRDLVSPENLAEALSKQKDTRLKLGVLAINSGIMTAAQVDKVHAEQQRVDKRIGDIMVEMGYATREQIEELFKTQPSGHLLLGQALVDGGYMTNAQFEQALASYKAENGISEADFYTPGENSTNKLVNQFYKFRNDSNVKYLTGYITLLLKNLVRFIGDDFTPLDAGYISEKICANCTGQRIEGKLKAVTIIDADENSAIEFASRFSGESLSAYDGYTQACIGEFLNLHNGLFAVNVSNEKGEELQLQPQSLYRTLNLSDLANAYIIPMCFSFGTVNFIISM
ncbi:MAG: chemotaxis protein CheX [Oscillospiraceae bacterium]|nr:chemotaxis protein CheX [Oscillospiraceae bacterium]